jgi:hypothetical protein
MVTFTLSLHFIVKKLGPKQLQRYLLLDIPLPGKAKRYSIPCNGGLTHDPLFLGCISTFEKFMGKKIVDYC